MKLSAVISSFNNEATIACCLSSIKGLVDETIFINNSSTDKTVQVARKFTKNIFNRPNNPMLNVNKNYGFSKAKGEWILNLDGDEEVSNELKEEILKTLNSQFSILNSGFWIPRKNIIFGKWIENSIWWPDYQLRLFRKGKGKFPELHVHEKIEVEGQTEKLKSPLIHYHYNSVSQWVQKMDTIYTESEVKNLIEQGKKVTWADAIRFPADDFLKTFFAQKGYKDGMHGLVLSLLQAFYAEVIFAKLWERQGFEEENNQQFIKQVYKELRRVKKELKYWFLTALIDETRNPLKKIALKFKRRKSRI